MAQQTINIGAAPNDNTGDPLRTAFNKANSNFTELYNLTRTQRSVTSAITVVATDQIINCNITGATSVTLPLASSRAGQPLTFKDVGGKFALNPLTINRTSPDTIEGLTSLTLSNNYAAVTLWPCNDGVNAGWFIL
jgi:hypothetical protein